MENEYRKSKDVNQKAYQWAQLLCHYAGEDENFFLSFWKRLNDSEPIYAEFCYYLEHDNFLAEYKVKGYSIIDIMIWQMDHFKAHLDRIDEGMKGNGDRMLLMAFDTMLKMQKDPEKYEFLVQSETGTDYEGKYK